MKSVGWLAVGMAMLLLASWLLFYIYTLAVCDAFVSEQLSLGATEAKCSWKPNFL